MTSSLEVTDNAARAVQQTPNRVALADIEAAIAQEYTLNAGTMVANYGGLPTSTELGVLTVCILVMKNGFVVMGKSAPADPGNFNAELGAKFAREDAVRQLWPLMGYALRDRLHP
jgi:hypothetical protein